MTFFSLPFPSFLFFEISKACIWELGNSRDVGKLRSQINLRATNGSDADEWDLVVLRMCARHWMGVNSGVLLHAHATDSHTNTQYTHTHTDE